MMTSSPYHPINWFYAQELYIWSDKHSWHFSNEITLRKSLFMSLSLGWIASPLLLDTVQICFYLEFLNPYKMSSRELPRLSMINKERTCTINEKPLLLERFHDHQREGVVLPQPDRGQCWAALRATPFQVKWAGLSLQTGSFLSWSKGPTHEQK